MGHRLRLHSAESVDSMALSQRNPSRGSLLLAPPMSLDPNFRRSVVLVCEHNDEGSFGLVLNRQIELTLSEVLEDEGLPPQPLCLGGPVEQNTLHYVHAMGDTLRDAIDVAPGVFWGGDFEQLKDSLRAGEASEENVRLFLGYAGWTAGQLEEEITADGWIVTEASAEVVFGMQPDALWRNVLKSMGGEYAAIANFPDDPRLN